MGLGQAEQEFPSWGLVASCLAKKARQFLAGGLFFVQTPSHYMPPEVTLAP